MASGKSHNTLWGFLAIGAIMVGFLVLQSKEARKQAEYKARIEAQQAEKQLQMALEAASDTSKTVVITEELTQPVVAAAAAPAATESAATGAAGKAGDSAVISSDSAVISSAVEKSAPVATVYTLENDLRVLEFVSAGAQPLSARVKDYTNYGGSPLYLYRNFDMAKDSLAAPAATEYNRLDFLFDTFSKAADGSVYKNTYHTAGMTFAPVDSLCNETTLALGTTFGPGQIIQTWSLEPGSYEARFSITFRGLEEVITRKVKSMNLAWNLAIPRMERGLRNEKQYSKVNYNIAGEDDLEDIGGGSDESTSEGASIRWIGYQQQFFSVILRKEGAPFSSAKKIAVGYKGENDPDHRLMDCQSTLILPYDGGSEEESYDFAVYMGPNDYYGLKSYDQNYEKVVPLGGWLVGWFTKWVIIPMFRFFHGTLGIVNFGLIILLMTIVIKLIVLPLAYKSYSSSAKMSALRPEMEKINDKFPKQEDAMKKQQATMELYRRAGVSPMGGCLPMLLQFPILWAMFRFFPASIELRQQPFLWCDDLSTYDNILPAGFELPLIGHLSLFALLMAVSMFFYSKVISTTQTAGNDPSAKMMKFMSVWLMPIMMFFICNSLSAGLSYYYLLSNLITMLETWIIRKWFVHPDEILARVRASEGKPLPKTKWQLRLEEAQKMQRQREQQMKNRR